VKHSAKATTTDRFVSQVPEAVLHQEVCEVEVWGEGRARGACLLEAQQHSDVIVVLQAV